MTISSRKTHFAWRVTLGAFLPVGVLAISLGAQALTFRSKELSKAPPQTQSLHTARPASALTEAILADSTVSVVTLTPTSKAPTGQLADLLKAEATKARVHGRTVFVNLGATWCGPCRALEEMLKDPRMIDAFSGTMVVHLDMDAWSDALDSLGFTRGGGTIPAIFAVDPNGKATGAVLRDTVGVVAGIEVAAPRIKRFVQAHRWQ